MPKVLISDALSPRAGREQECEKRGKQGPRGHTTLAAAAFPPEPVIEAILHSWDNILKLS